MKEEEIFRRKLTSLHTLNFHSKHLFIIQNQNFSLKPLPSLSTMSMPLLNIIDKLGVHSKYGCFALQALQEIYHKTWWQSSH